LILLCGIPSEPPLALVREALAELNACSVAFNQRCFADMRLSFEIAAGIAGGELSMNGATFRLQDFTGAYLRIMDDRFLPELKGQPPDSPARLSCRALHDTLLQWSDVAHGNIVNRCSPMASNSSKPFQAQLIRRHGFDMPETLITNDPDLVDDFLARHHRIIYKSISGVRSIVRTFDKDDAQRVDLIRWCPVQFQEFIEGENVRVHVVGSRVFATRVVSEATDYRYAHEQVGQAAQLQPLSLPDDMAERCVELTAGLGLSFAGIDLKLSPENRCICFEVNPSPGFSYFEAHTGQPIARAVAEYLIQVTD